MGAETRTEVQISLNYPNGATRCCCCCCACTHSLLRCRTAGALALPTFRGSPHEKISMRFTYQHLLFLLSLSLYQSKLTGFYLSMVDAQIRITLTSEGSFSFPWSCHLNLKAYHFPHQATVMFLHPCFTSFLCAAKLCVTQENERKSFLFSLHPWRESSVISYVVNNAFSFSCTLKFVLKQFRKLVEVESYSNLKSLGLPLQSHLFFHSLSCILFPIIIVILFYSLILNFMHWFPPRNSFPVVLWWGESGLIDSHIGCVFKVPFRVSILISELLPVS